MFDSAGDIEIQGVETFEFSYSSKYGLNPFGYSSDPDFGGPMPAIQSFLSIMRHSHRSLSTLQENEIAEMAIALYASLGVTQGNSASWANGKCFSLPDFVSRVDSIIKSKETGIPLGCVAKAAELNSKRITLEKKLLKSETDPTIDAFKLKSSLVALGADWLDVVGKIDVQDFFNQESTGNVNSLRSIRSVFKTLERSGVFTGADPAPAGRAIRYLARGLEMTQQVLLADTLLKSIYQHHVRSCRVLNAPPTCFIVVDEVKLISSPAFTDKTHIVNRLLEEARKYGIGTIFAGQSLEHIPPGCLANFGSAIIQPVPPLARAKIKRTYDIGIEAQASLIPKQQGFVSLDLKEFTRTDLWRMM